ncbi:MBOAT family protein [Flavobacterium sp. CYK-4]|uniref:MBOAT family O-acyltransferase n=1 Tax=Flavobacterium lotistagni TaxID=2709660 RepID=UPI00140D5385|nr:MBOAT family O-acyltransferase [Flavobacterium lotistagni]NHM06568.1 MBOAT family protein [Flavobacterium lotistagni]
MLFNSIDFAVFFPAVFVLYWWLNAKNLKLQNGLLVLAGFVFYGWWDWRFLFLLIFSAMVDFCVGLALKKENHPIRRKALLGISIALNLGLLGFFKYYNFFTDNFIAAFRFFGQELDVQTLKVILPVGISFYTFQSLSYGISVYRRQLEPTNDVVAFLAFVSFFPQLVAGPIERAAHFLPQFYKKRHFDYQQAVSGMRLILWGFFKKIVIADNCAPYVNDIFSHYPDYSSGTLILGAVLFSFQIYGDFSGYSDIAIGLARLLGFDMMRNFNYPYFSKNMAEFWQRWHISLTTWFREYLYWPLGGNRGSKLFKIRNVFIVFLVSGFWHGANWTFVFWGAINALFLLPLLIVEDSKKPEMAANNRGILASVTVVFQMLFTFSLVTFAWIFFRAKSLTEAFQYIGAIVHHGGFFKIRSEHTFEHWIAPLLCYILFLFVVEGWQNNQKQVEKPLLASEKWTAKTLRYSFYFITLLCIILNIKNQASSFIYFQF